MLRPTHSFHSSCACTHATRAFWSWFSKMRVTQLVLGLWLRPVSPQMNVLPFLEGHYPRERTSAKFVDQLYQ